MNWSCWILRRRATRRPTSSKHPARRRGIVHPLTVAAAFERYEDGRFRGARRADKVTVNTAAVERPELIPELSREFRRASGVLGD